MLWEQKVMTLRNVLAQKKLAVYQLSKITGISKATLFNIFNGQSDIKECRVKHVAKIAEALSMPIEDILKLDPVPYNAFFERNLTVSLKKSVELLKTKKLSLLRLLLVPGQQRHQRR